MSEKILGFHTGIRQESGLAFKVPQARMAESGGGGATGGAARATTSFAEAIAVHAPDILREEGYTHFSGVDVLYSTPEPYAGYDVRDANLPANMRTQLYPLPRNPDGTIPQYDQMVDMYTGDQALMAATEADLKAMAERGPTFSLGHFWVDLAVRNHIINRLGLEIPGYASFHSALALQIKAENPRAYADLVSSGNLSAKRQELEQILFGSNVTLFSTDAERRMSIEAYAGRTVNGRVLQREELENNTLVVPLTIDSDLYSPESPDAPNKKKIEQRRAHLAQYGITDDDFVIGGVLRLDDEKGYDEFARAFMEYLVRFKPTSSSDKAPKLYFSGGVPNKPGMPEKYAALMAQIADFEAEFPQYAGHVVIPNDALDHKLIANASDWVVGPSKTETFHLVPKEANAAGVPVALTRIAAHLATHGDNAPYFDLFQADGSINYESIWNMIDLMRDPQQTAMYRELGIQNSRRFSKRAVADTLVKDMLNRYSHMFGPRWT
jgi:glycosyltransferase involved in cell wall biosynthesis